MSKRLEGQSAIVTGSSKGIGAACAVALAEAGANVAINHRSSEEEAEKVAEECESHGVRAIVLQADVSKEDDVKALIESTCSAFGRLDIMVANAGVQADEPFLDMSLEAWQKVIGIDLTGQFLCAREAARRFKAQGRDGGPSRAAGKIVHMSSVHDEIPWAGHANYAAAKGGVKELMRTEAQELAPLGIRVNAISPGAIKTSINEDVWSDEEARKKLLTLIPYGRIGEPKDVAGPLVWLVSDEADYVTGLALYVDGGMMLYPGFQDNG